MTAANELEQILGIDAHLKRVAAENWLVRHGFDALLDLRQLEKVRKLVSLQAEDEGIWFSAMTAPEEYLQKELRKLHQVVERDGV